ncbi:molybdopterin oxidoreductase family protein [Aliivibrio finisterrensis]|uniref:molybdopterin oxidoreductase family protein n=1 Tax=Aliivibrio finisterrensis TaxID=511998 RepID=UPI001A913898|nr:nitrate reductase [Aliivibrio finisterrensis]
MSDDKWIKTTCAYCGVGCGVEAIPNSDGSLTIRGDKEHPSNYGRLCTKGAALGETVKSDNRLLHPMLRAKKDHTLSVTHWPEVTQHIAEQFQQTIEKYGPDSVAFYVSGQLLTEDYYVANKLMKGFIGSANIDSNSRLCMASSVVGHKRAFGSDTVPICYDDLEHAELVVITGSNLAWCHPVLFQRLRTAKQNNPDLKIVVIDPRKTETCDIADLHLPIRSGSDVALFNGLLSYLAKHNKLNHDYIKKHTNGFDNAIKSIENNNIIEEITNIDYCRIEQFYQWFSQYNKVMTIYSQGVNQSSQGSDKVNSILNCHLATGKIGYQGCGPFSITGQPNAMGGREVGGLANTLAAHMEFDDPAHHQLISDFWQTDSLAIKEGIKAIDLFDAMDNGKIKAIWIMATNPVVSLPDSQKVISALSKCPFVVVSDCINNTDTMEFADVVLPAQGWSEKSGTVTNSERRISRQRRILPSPEQAKPDWWIISQVAQQMGFKKQFNYRHEGDVFKEYAQMTTLGQKDKPRDLNLIGLTMLDDQGYSELSPQQWPVLELQTNIEHQRLFSDGQFYTADKKARFIAVNYLPPQQDTTATFPLLLNTGRTRDHWHTMSRTGLSETLASHSPEPFVQIHPNTAKAYQLANDHIATIYNVNSEIQARVKITDDIAESSLFMPIHWNSSTAKNSKPCLLIHSYIDEISGQPEFKHTPVNIKTWQHKSEALFITRTKINTGNFDYWVVEKIPNGYLYRIASTLNTIELIILLSNLLDNKNNKIDKKLILEPKGEYRQIVLTNAHLQAAFIVSHKIESSQKEWLLALNQHQDYEALESHFFYTNYSK